MDPRRGKKKIVSESNIRKDFMELNDNDVAFTIFTYLDDVADIIRASAVSRSWRHFVLSNASGLYQNLCFRKAPGMRKISSVNERIEAHILLVNGVGYPITSEYLEKDTKMYSHLLRALSMCEISEPREVIKCVLGASSTNKYPEQSIVHILFPADNYSQFGDSYWSSRGRSDPNMPESILFQLESNFCIVTEIDIHPYKAVSEHGSPIYSPRSVRFRMGHPKLRVDMNVDLKSLPWQELNDDKYEWTYMSQEFPVSQEDRLQRFKLDEPLICVGGFLQIELLGRAQCKQEDGLYYICINSITVLGHPLSPAFHFEVGTSGKMLLTLCNDDVRLVMRRISGDPEVEEKFDINSPQILQIRRLMRRMFPHKRNLWDYGAALD